MLRNGRTGHNWHLVVDHIMLVMKIRSSSPASRPVKRILCACTKEKITNKKTKKKEKESGYLQPAVNGYHKKVVFISCFAYYPFIGSMY